MDVVALLCLIVTPVCREKLEIRDMEKKLQQQIEHDLHIVSANTSVAISFTYLILCKLNRNRLSLVCVHQKKFDIVFSANN